MATTRLPQDFKEFLKLLNEHNVRYFIIGGYAVGYHGYPRATADMDILIGLDKNNAKSLAKVLYKFGFELPEVSPELFLQKNKIIRLGNPPIRIEIHTSISGVDFDECYPDRVLDNIEEIPVKIISLKYLQKNKRESGRFKGLDNLKNLPE